MSNEQLTKDKFKDECGVFVIVNHGNAADIAYYGLHALQHRGQESAGIVASDDGKLRVCKGMGLVTDVFSDDHNLRRLTGSCAIGHVRYTTHGFSDVENAQPLVLNFRLGKIALAHNGNLVNATQIKHYLERQGSIFQTSTDTEVIAHLIARSVYDSVLDATKEALSMIKGAYALMLMTKEGVIAARDPYGLRLLSIGKLDGSYILASETCAFDVIGAEFVRDVHPGELIMINQDGLQCYQFSPMLQRATCSFEHIYFARPDSDIAGVNVHHARRRLGRQLAKESPAEADVVTGVPDSSLSAAMGYAEAADLPYEMGLIKNRYIGRTFIQPTQKMRTQGVKMKLSPIRKIVAGKRIIMVDDSIVRGTTSSLIVHMLREAGAKEVHVRISSPPVAHPCFYGIDTSRRDQLIISHKSIEEIREFIGADSLSFLSIEGTIAAIEPDGVLECNNLCLACFNGQYPTETYGEYAREEDSGE